MGVQPVEVNLANPSTIEAALQGVTKVFYATGFGLNLPQEQQLLIDAIVKYNESHNRPIQHLVELSAVGIELPMTLGRWLTQSEAAIKSSGIPYTILRPNSFHQNVGNFYGQSIKSAGGIYAPFGKGRIAFIDSRDIGAVAAEVFSRTSEFLGQTIELSGSEALDHYQVAELLTKVTGNKVSYYDIPKDQYKKTMTGYGVPEQMVDIMMGLYDILYNSPKGEGAHLTKNVENILGRKPILLERYIRDNLSLFKEVQKVRVLIAGSGGNIGSHVAKNLLFKHSANVTVSIDLSRYR